jgi:hypothetical protein
MLQSGKRRNTMKISIILEARQEIMKMSPIYLSERSPFIVKAYRYDEDMDKELEIHF